MELQKMFIDGEWVEGSTGKSVPTLNPSNGEVLAMVTEGNVEELIFLYCLLAIHHQ